MRRVWQVSVFICLLLVSVFGIREYKEQKFIENYSKRVLVTDESHLDHSQQDERILLVDDRIEGELKETYQVNHLDKEEAYLVDKLFHLNFYFDKEADRADVDGVMTLYSKMFFGDFGGLSSYVPYFDVLIDDQAFDDVVLRIFVDQELILYKHYDFNLMQEDYYENMNPVIQARSGGKSDLIQPFSNQVAELIKVAYVEEYQKPLKPFLHHFKYISEKPLKASTIEAIQELVESDLGPSLENHSKALFGMNQNALGILLRFESNEGVYDEKFFFNGDEKSWIEEDWMSVDMFQMNGYK